MDRPATLKDLVRAFGSEGRVEAIVLRPGRDGPALCVPEAVAEPGRGLLGDRRAATRRNSPQARDRELTMVQAEHLPLLAAWCGLPGLPAERLRRNLVISGLNLRAMRSPFADLRLTWRVGEQAVLEVTGPCDPCSRLARALGPGSYNALRGHGGMTARLLEGGTLRVGDRVRLLSVQALPRAE